MIFGRKDRLAIECEVTDRSKPYLFGKVRVWFGDLALGDFAAEIISTYVFAAEIYGRSDRAKQSQKNSHTAEPIFALPS